MRISSLWRVKFTLTAVLGLTAGFSVYGVPGQPTYYASLHNFTNSPPDGNQPLNILLGPDNAIYGVTYGGGTNANPGGTIFRVNRDGSGYSVLKSFDAATTGNSNGVLDQFPTTQLPQYGGLSLMLAHDGFLYGTTFFGGANNQGTVFKLNRDGSGFTTIRDFGPGDFGPVSLIQGNDGALYGATLSDGANNDGTLFRLTTDGNNYTVLHNFSSITDGMGVVEPLMQAKDGLLYGSLYLGTNHNSLGTIFKINPADQSYTVLHYFGAADGFHPSRLVQGSDGLLYGTTILGPGANRGAIFEMDTNGNNYAKLYVFTNSLQGWMLHNGLVAGPGHNFYGAAEWGGTGPGGQQGTVYQFNTLGTNLTVLYNFNSTNNGQGYMPFGGLVLGDFSNGGILFGTTVYGGGGIGTSGYNGTLFSLTVNPPLFITPATVQTADGQVTILWPAWAQNYVLQTAPSPGSTNWTTVDPTNQQVIGVQMPASAAGGYYRLAYPGN